MTARTAWACAMVGRPARIRLCFERRFQGYSHLFASCRHWRGSADFM